MISNLEAKHQQHICHFHFNCGRCWTGSNLHSATRELMTVIMVMVTMMVAVQLHGGKGGGQWLALMVLMMMLHLCSLTWQLALRFAAHAHGRLTD